MNINICVYIYTYNASLKTSLGCIMISLFYTDNCLWGAWIDVPCDCSTATKQLSRAVLRNSTGAGHDCKGDSTKTEQCNCQEGQ